MLVEKLQNCPLYDLDSLYAEEMIFKLARHTSFNSLECYILAFKLLLSIGFDNSLNLLQDKYGKISFASVYFMFFALDTKNIKAPDTSLMAFLFNDGKNCTMTFILNGKCKNLYLNFAFFYENFNYYKDQLNGKLSKKRTEELLMDRFVTSSAILPCLSRDILNDFVKSYSNRFMLDLTSEEIIKISENYYQENMRKLIYASIPEYHLVLEDFSVDVLAKNDPKNLVMGYRTNNCWRLNGDAMILFSEAVKNEHFRLVSISSNNDEDIAMMLLARNGNVLIAQGIEISKSYQDYFNRQKIYNVCKEFLQNLMLNMNTQGDNIVAVVMGISNNNVRDFNYDYLPFRVMPILKNANFYYNGFQFCQCLIALESSSTFNDINLFEPSIKYYDVRKEVLHWVKGDYSYLRNLVDRNVLAISFYAQNYVNRIIGEIKYSRQEIYCNNDWYLIVLENGDIKGAYLDYDPRAKEEYDFYYNYLKRQNNCRKRLKVIDKSQKK